MNGRKAKELRKKAAELMWSLGVSLSEGHREYKQAENCKAWGPAMNPDGTRMKGVDGVGMMKQKLNPGSVYSQWKWRVFYRFLKKTYKRGDKDAKKILDASKEELVQMFGGL